MKVVCQHGYFKFYPAKPDDLRRFEKIQGLSLKADNDHYTFEILKDLPRYSLKGHMFGGLPAVETIEGREASEVMRANVVVYNIGLDLIMPVSAILNQTSIPLSQDYAVAGRVLIQPGTILQSGQRLLGYQGMINQDFQRLYIYSMELSA